MLEHTEKRHQDIAFFQIDKSPPPPKKTNPLAAAAAGVIVAVILIGAGYYVGWRAGYFAAPCCLGSIDLEIDLSALTSQS